MIFTNDDPIEFAERHKIEIKTGECLKCKKEVTPSMPFITKSKEYVGLASEDHGCGRRYQYFIYAPTSPKKRRELGDALKEIIKKGKVCFSPGEEI